MERPTGKKTQLVSGTTMEQYVIKKAVPKLFLFPFKLFFNKINIKSNIGMKMNKILTK